MAHRNQQSDWEPSDRTSLKGKRKSQTPVLGARKLCSLRLFAELSSSSPTLLGRAHVLQVVLGQKCLVSREPSLFSHGQVKSITYTPGCTSSNSSRDRRPSFPAIVSRWVVLRNHQHFKHTTPPASASAMIRFISLNLSVSECTTPLALLLPLLNYESCRFK